MSITLMLTLLQTLLHHAASDPKPPRTQPPIENHQSKWIRWMILVTIITRHWATHLHAC